jgi:hypothetical protein
MDAATKERVKQRLTELGIEYRQGRDRLNQIRREAGLPPLPPEDIEDDVDLFLSSNGSDHLM